MENLFVQNVVLTVDGLVPIALGILNSIKLYVKNREGVLLGI